MIRLVYPLVALALFTQCQQEDETGIHSDYKTEAQAGDVKFGQEVLIQHRGQISLYGGDVPRRLIVSLEELQDSRCPVNTNCITYGSAKIVLRASNSQGVNENIPLCIGACSTEPKRDTHTVTAEVGGIPYRFTLKEIKPYPGLAHEGEVQKARIVIEKI